LKIQGNESISKSKLPESAVQYYTAGIELIESYLKQNNIELPIYDDSLSLIMKTVIIDLCNLYANRSTVYNKLNNLSLSLSDCNYCISLYPKWSKGHSIKASTLYQQQLYEQAIQEFQICLSCHMKASERTKIQIRADAAYKKLEQQQAKKININVQPPSNIIDNETDVPAPLKHDSSNSEMMEVEKIPMTELSERVNPPISPAKPTSSPADYRRFPRITYG
jgi:tetratricopeptide (TPR) repeat protein